MSTRGYVRLLTVAGIMSALLLVAVLLVRYVIEGPRGRSPSVLVVVIDTLRADRAYGPASKMPFFTQLARRGVVFTQARSVAEWTLPSHASLFTGKLPSEHGATFEHRTLPSEAATLAEVLATYGYATAGFTANVNVSSLYGFEQGFDRFVEAWRTPAGKDRTRASDTMIDELLAWWDATPHRPVFMFLNLMDAHLPYDADPESLAAAGPDARAIPQEILAASDLFERVLAGEVVVDEAFARALAARYGAAVQTADRKLERLVLELERREFFEHGVLVVTSDHGENLGENGRVDHQGVFDETLLRVPLLLYGERVPANVVRDEPITTARLFPWLVDLANGASKLPTPGETALVAERYPAIEIAERLAAKRPHVDRTTLERGEVAIVPREGGRKLLLTPGREPRLFDIEGPAAAERELDAKAESEWIERLQRDWARVRQLARPVRETYEPERSNGVEDSETWQRLAELGYVGARTEVFSMHAQEHLSRGNRAFQRKDYAAARTDFEAATRLDPNFVDAWFNLALALERTDLESALQIWEHYLALALKQGGQDAASIEHAMGRVEALKAPAPPK
ncbi:MAG: sulfatase-like hydrolase/transferase [Planctomycetes bacterium]|nr:sulfatase-like hydrolase/transferase [Planctomycetota bacterium]